MRITLFVIVIIIFKGKKIKSREKNLKNSNNGSFPKTVLIRPAADLILETQNRLANLKTSSLWITRILFLQLPVWTTFYWNKSMLENGNMLLWIIQGIVTISFTGAAIWLFFKIKYQNRNKKWFKFIFNGKEWFPLVKSMELLEQMDDYKEKPEAATTV